MLFASALCRADKLAILEHGSCNISKPDVLGELTCEMKYLLKVSHLDSSLGGGTGERPWSGSLLVQEGGPKQAGACGGAAGLPRSAGAVRVFGRRAAAARVLALPQGFDMSVPLQQLYDGVDRAVQLVYTRQGREPPSWLRPPAQPLPGVAVFT